MTGVLFWDVPLTICHYWIALIVPIIIRTRVCMIRIFQMSFYLFFSPCCTKKRKVQNPHPKEWGTYWTVNLVLNDCITVRLWRDLKYIVRPLTLGVVESLSDLWLIQANGAILLSSSLLCLRETTFRIWLWLKTVSEISSIRLFSKCSSCTSVRTGEKKCLAWSASERKRLLIQCESLLN